MSIKEKFVVSAKCKNISTDLESILLADPYIKGHLEIIETESKKIRIAEYQRKTKEDLINAQEYVERKYDLYITILSERLNSIHKREYNSMFWYKSLNFALKRQITMLYDSFQIFEANFNDKLHEIKVLDEKSYFIPNNYDEATTFLKGTDYGQEQLFSIYIKYFYPNRYLENRYNAKFTVENTNHNTSFYKKLLKPILFISNSYHSLNFKLNNYGYRNLFSLILKKIITDVFSLRQPKVGIFHSFFSLENQQYLTVKSMGLISILKPKVFFQLSGYQTEIKKRAYLSAIENNFDRFDRYFFYSLQYFLPKSFLEGFDEIEEYYKKYITNKKQLKYVVSEAWISNDFLSIAIAIFQKFGIKHINNEHNFLSHYIQGNNIKRTAELSDIFTTIGWQNNDFPNLIKGASLCELSINKEYKKENLILYITHFVGAKRTDFFSGYHMFAEDGRKFLESQNIFLSKISDKVKRNIVFRGYPQKEKNKYLIIDDLVYLSDHIKNCKYVDDFEFSSKIMMKKSRLVILTYISTGLLETFIMNIPVIIFLEISTFHIEDAYSNFFEELIDANIIQTSPIQAALFIEKIFLDPEAWWFSEKVQIARIHFMEKNIANPNVMLDYLMNLLK